MEEEDLCQQLQEEELVALSAIYGRENVIISRKTSVIVFTLHQVTPEASIDCFIPRLYPLKSIPKLELNCRHLCGTTLDRWTEETQGIAIENAGNVCLFQMINYCLLKLQEYTKEQSHTLITSSSEVSDMDPKNVTSIITEIDDIPSRISKKSIASSLRSASSTTSPLIIYSGTVFIDRKSGFQAHLALISADVTVEHVLSKLMENKKIAQATHRIMAYRLYLNRSSIAQDFDDDGETGAGHRLLFLLKTMRVLNVCIVVARWFGGIKLGSDRFKHIQNVARNLIEQCRSQIPFES